MTAKSSGKRKSPAYRSSRSSTKAAGHKSSSSKSSKKTTGSKKKGSGSRSMSGKLYEEEKKIEEKENELEALEKKELSNEQQEIKNEKKEEQMQGSEEDEFEKLENLEEDLKKKKFNPLTKITYHDIVKGFIGAFAGIVGHFAFIHGPEIGRDLTMTRAILLLLLSFIITVLLLYLSGFRRVKEVNHTKFLPLRALTIYFTALGTILLVLWLFGFLDNITFHNAFKSVAAISVIAMLGAGTADLIGKE